MHTVCITFMKLDESGHKLLLFFQGTNMHKIIWQVELCVSFVISGLLICIHAECITTCGVPVGLNVSHVTVTFVYVSAKSRKTNREIKENNIRLYTLPVAARWICCGILVSFPSTMGVALAAEKKLLHQQKAHKKAYKMITIPIRCKIGVSTDGFVRTIAMVQKHSKHCKVSSLAPKNWTTWAKFDLFHYAVRN